MHFFVIAANLMRQILVDHAKTNNRLKRGGVKSNLPIEEALTIASDGKDFYLISLDEALARHAEMDSQQARIVELKFFGGLATQETAEVLGISPKIFLPTSKVVYNLLVDTINNFSVKSFGKPGT